ncbi:hypothetical protein BDP27DRAFT_1417084 [Rhodocollybia butyracea]|uniref:Uncharacterized protein n=1 Tax=Rhodocollybia butyracea TaxID=206335 RepID=A0A9P5PW68_9AGAR|nr:hypothetical protein BDP27DRAFT_1417084 [Rhodocollybia butyracea]
MAPNALEVLKNGLVKLKKQVQQRKDGLLKGKDLNNSKNPISHAEKTVEETLDALQETYLERPSRREALQAAIIMQRYIHGMDVGWMSPLHASLRTFWLHLDKRHAWKAPLGTAVQW